MGTKEKLFSVKNINNHKQVMILGLKFKFKNNTNLEIQKEVTKYLITNYINPYFNNKLEKFEIKPKKDLQTDKIIWQYWGQGIDNNTPKIVKSCLNSVSYYMNDYKQIILNNETVKEYLDLPDFVWEKLNYRSFNYTFFSDLLRVCLLSTYGGIWIDATILLTDRINQKYLKSKFFTFQRCPETDENIKEIFSKYNSSYFSWDKNNRVNWLSSFIISSKDNLIIDTLKDILLNYWEKEASLRHYFLIHLIFNELIKLPQYAKENCKKVEDISVHFMQINAFKEYTPELWQSILDKSSIHKLSHHWHIIKDSEHIRIVDKAIEESRKIY